MPGMKTRQRRTLLDAAARIVQDATEVDWSREPLTEYEAAIRAEYLGAGLLTLDGRSEIMHLAIMREPNAASDLRAASDEAVRIIAARLASYERTSLAAARRAVDARKPRR